MPFVPTDIAGCKIWLDASRITGLADGASVTTWSDSSGNSNDATQGTAANKPTYKIGVANGKPVVRFDGTDDYMTIADNANYKTTNISVFIVAKTGSNFSPFLNYPQATPTHTDPFFRWSFLHSSSTLSCRWNGTNVISTLTYDNTKFHVFDLRNADGKVNEVLFCDGTDADLTYPNAVGIYIGSNVTPGEFSNMDAAEIILYDTSLSDANRGIVSNYLTTKWINPPNWSLDNASANGGIQLRPAIFTPGNAR